MYFIHFLHRTFEPLSAQSLPIFYTYFDLRADQKKCDVTFIPFAWLLYNITVTKTVIFWRLNVTFFKKDNNFCLPTQSDRVLTILMIKNQGINNEFGIAARVQVFATTLKNTRYVICALKVIYFGKQITWRVDVFIGLSQHKFRDVVLGKLNAKSTKLAMPGL